MSGPDARAQVEVVFDYVREILRQELLPVWHELRHLNRKMERTMGIEADIAAAAVDIANTVSDLNANVVTLEGDFADELSKLDAALAKLAQQQNPAVDMASLNASLSAFQTLKTRLVGISAGARTAIDAATNIPAIPPGTVITPPAEPQPGSLAPPASTVVPPAAAQGGPAADAAADANKKADATTADGAAKAAEDPNSGA